MYLVAENEHSGDEVRPLVCVTTPVYNGAAHLEEACIRSVRAQTYRPLVHTIVDNGSTDATPELIARYAAEVDYPVIVQRNGVTVRQPENFNCAAAMVPAEAAYFTVLCADDTMAPTALEEMMALAATRETADRASKLRSVAEDGTSLTAKILQFFRRSGN